MGSHICRDCGAQVTAAPGVVHHCPVRERRAFEARLNEALAAARTARALAAVGAERGRQEEIGLGRRADGIDWRSCADPAMAGGDGARYLVLGEEVGEVANAILEAGYGNGATRHLREELVQVAAVAVAWVEAIDARETADALEAALA